MNTTKITVVTTIALLTALSSGIALYQRSENRRAQAALAEAQRPQTTLRAEIQELEHRLRASTENARAAEEDGAALLGTLDSAAALQAASPAVAPKITKEVVDARFKRAQELAKAGRAEEALQEYLWCYDEGMPAIPSFSGLRISRLVELISTLGQTHPPALAALRKRRDQARARVLAGAEDHGPALDFGSLNEVLKEPALTLVLYDQLPLEDTRRSNLGLAVYGQLVDARRYKDAVKSAHHTNMGMVLDMTMNPGFAAQMASANPSESTQQHRAGVAKMAAAQIEVLAGAGDLANARSLLARVLKFDDSTATRATLQTHLTRAGHPELLAPAAP